MDGEDNQAEMDIEDQQADRIVEKVSGVEKPREVDRDMETLQ